MSDLYQKIESLCKENGLSITSMCKEAGVSRAPLSDLKAGRSKTLATATLAKIATRLNVSIDYLMGESKNKPATAEDDELAQYLEELKTRPEMRMLFSITKGATKEDVERAVKIVEAALGK